jgi:sec-independent protein translocase protein TatB
LFDVDVSELAVIAVVALIVIGPKDLPKVLRAMGQMTRKAKLLAGEFQKGVDDMMRESEIDEMRKKVEAMNQIDVKREVEKIADPTGEIEKALAVDNPLAETPAPEAPPPEAQPAEQAALPASSALPPKEAQT